MAVIRAEMRAQYASPQSNALGDSDFPNLPGRDQGRSERAHSLPVKPHQARLPQLEELRQELRGLGLKGDGGHPRVGAHHHLDQHQRPRPHHLAVEVVPGGGRVTCRACNKPTVYRLT